VTFDQERITRDDHGSGPPPPHDTDPDELAVCPYAGERTCPVVGSLNKKMNVMLWHMAELAKLRKPVQQAGLAGLGAVLAAILWELFRIAGH